VWAEKGKLGKGAIGYADGMFYCLEEGSGTVALIEASVNGWNEKAASSSTRKPPSAVRTATSGPIPSSSTAGYICAIRI
jgi:hypothetical protein